MVKECVRSEITINAFTTIEQLIFSFLRYNSRKFDEITVQSINIYNRFIQVLISLIIYIADLC